MTTSLERKALFQVMLSLVFGSLLFCPLAKAQDADPEIWDPIEPVNRGIFWFNDRLDRNILEPVARGYDAIMPLPAQTGVRNFFSNIRSPITIVNSLLQAEVTQAANATGRFLINTTIGIGGLIDVAKYMGLEKKEEDMGLTFATWGIPHGPYLVLPLLGPSSVRDGTGKLGDQFLDPTYYIGYLDWSDNTQLAWILGLKTLDVIDTRASLIDAVDAARESSVDYYLFVQSAYYQIRRGKLHGDAELQAGKPDAVPVEDDDITFKAEEDSQKVKP